MSPPEIEPATIAFQAGALDHWATLTIKGIQFKLYTNFAFD